MELSPGRGGMGWEGNRTSPAFGTWQLCSTTCLRGSERNLERAQSQALRRQVARVGRSLRVQVSKDLGAWQFGNRSLGGGRDSSVEECGFVAGGVFGVSLVQRGAAAASAWKIKTVTHVQ
jgi:hypothetical protein